MVSCNLKSNVGPKQRSYPYVVSNLLTPKGQMGFFEFRLGSHFLDLQPNFSIFRTRMPHEDLCGYVIFFSKLCIDLEI